MQVRAALDRCAFVWRGWCVASRDFGRKCDDAILDG